MPICQPARFYCFSQPRRQNVAGRLPTFRVLILRFYKMLTRLAIKYFSTKYYLNSLRTDNYCAYNI